MLITKDGLFTIILQYYTADRKIYQIVPLFYIGTPRCFIPIGKEQLDSNEKAQLDHRL